MIGLRPFSSAAPRSGRASPGEKARLARSAPAQKPLPAPVIRTARHSGSVPARLIPADSASIRAALSALSRSGRLRVSVSTPPSSLSKRTDCDETSASAVTGVLPQFACRRRPAQASILDTGQRRRQWRNGIEAGSGERCAHDRRSLHLRLCAHADRPLRRRAGQPPRRRSRGAADPRADAPSSGSRRQNRRGLSRLRQPGRRGQPQPRAHGAPARGLARVYSGRDRQPPLRLGNGSGRRRGAGDQGGRDRARDRGRRGIDDPRALRDGQGAGGVSAIGGGFRHHHRLALRQSDDEKALWRRFDAGDGGERRRRAPGLARRPGRVRAALAKARCGGSGEGDVRTRKSSRSRSRTARET